MLKNLYKRFGVETSVDEAERVFKNQCCRLIDKGILGEELDLIIPMIGFRLGIRTESTRHVLGHLEDSSLHDYSRVLNEALPLNEFMLRLQMMLNFLRKQSQKVADDFAQTIRILLKQSSCDLNYKIVISKNKAPQIYSATSPFLDELLDQTLGILDADLAKYGHVIENFEEGLKELTKAGSNCLKLKDVCEDMLNTCDEAAKIIIGDKNVGLAQLLKKDESLPLIGQQKNIYSAMRDLLDKIKHGTIKDFARKDVEELVYLTAVLIKRLFG